MKVADMHCDTVCELMKPEISGDLKSSGLSVDIDKLKTGDYMLQNFAMFVDMRKYTDCYKRCTEMIAYFKKFRNKYENDIGEAVCVNDIIENMKDNKISAMITVEEGECCKGDEQKLDELYLLGVRMMTVTWNYENSLGYPATPKSIKTGKSISDGGDSLSKGLTYKGKNIVSHMLNDLGMIVDVSHLSDKGFYDVYDIAKTAVKRPIVASHSNARSLAAHKRNLSDEMIKIIGQTGGVIGVNFYPPFLSEKNISQDEQLSCLIAHIRHMINKGGIGCVGLGTDFDGIDGNLAIPYASKMQDLYKALQKAGFSENEIEHIFWINVINVYKEFFG